MSSDELMARFKALQSESPKKAKSEAKQSEAKKGSVKEAEPEPSPEPEKIELPHGWEAIQSRSTGDTFFHHKKTGKTTWTKPTEEIPPLHDYRALVLKDKIFPCSNNILEGTAKVAIKKSEEASKEISDKIQSACGKKCPKLENLGIMKEMESFEFFPRQVGYGDIPGEVLFVPQGCIFYKGIQKPLLKETMKKTKEILDKLPVKMLQQLTGWYASKSVAEEYAEYGIVCFKIRRPVILMNILDIRNVHYLNQLIKKSNQGFEEANLQNAIMSKKTMKIREIKGLDENGSIRTLNPTEVIHCGKHLGNCEGCIHRLSGDYDTVFERIMEDTPEYCDGYFGDTTITSPDRIFYHEAYFRDDTVRDALEFISPQEKATSKRNIRSKRKTPGKRKKPGKRKRPQKKDRRKSSRK